MTSPGPDINQTEQGRYTVHEAALLLGLSVEAIRKRAERGKLASVKGEDGTRYILLDEDQTKTGLRPNNDQTELVESLQDQIEFLREELRRREEEHQEETRRKDHLLAAALERIPALEEASSKKRESPVAPTGGNGSGEAPPDEENPSWWRRLFGAPQSRST